MLTAYYKQLEYSHSFHLQISLTKLVFQICFCLKKFIRNLTKFNVEKLGMLSF
jgi:hypothetical protein